VSVRGDTTLAPALAASLDLVRASSGAAAGSCGGAVMAVLPLGGRRSARAAVQVVARAGGATERDTVRLVCTRAP
jgi:uncharacterized protein (DUF1501 family)